MLRLLNLGLEGGIGSGRWTDIGTKAVEHRPDLGGLLRHCYTAVGSTNKALARKNPFMHQRRTIDELVLQFPNLMPRLVAIKFSLGLQLEPGNPM